MFKTVLNVDPNQFFQTLEKQHYRRTDFIFRKLFSTKWHIQHTKLCFNMFFYKFFKHVTSPTHKVVFQYVLKLFQQDTILNKKMFQRVFLNLFEKSSLWLLTELSQIVHGAKIDSLLSYNRLAWGLTPPAFLLILWNCKILRL